MLFILSCMCIFVKVYAYDGKSLRTNQIARMRNSIILLDKRKSSDRGYNCEAKLSRGHF